LNSGKSLLLLGIGIFLGCMKSIFFGGGLFFLFLKISSKLKDEKIRKKMILYAGFLSVEVAMSFPIFISPSIRFFSCLPKNYDLTWKLSVVIIPLIFYLLVTFLVTSINEKIQKKILFSSLSLIILLVYLYNQDKQVNQYLLIAL
jgi:hypothetical protein